MTDPAAIAAVVIVVIVTAIIAARGIRVACTLADFLVAARQVPALLNASAISGEYLSAASFLGIAGLALVDGLGALWYAVGYAAGYLVLLTVVAAPLRRFGAYTIPDFAEGRLDSPMLRQVASVMVLVICGFYLLPQLKGAGITLSLALNGPYWIGVVSVGVVVTFAIASGGMKGITFVQALQYWLKITAISLPAFVLLFAFQHPPLADLRGPAPATFHTRTKVEFPESVTVRVSAREVVLADGVVDGNNVQSTLVLHPGTHSVANGTTLTFSAGSPAPVLSSSSSLGGNAWISPLFRLSGARSHGLATTYGILIATFLGTLGLPHILVRFYTNSDGRAARRTTSLVLLLLGCFYVFPGIFALLGRLEAPGLYATGQTDSVVMVLPHLVAEGFAGSLLTALVVGGAVAAFLSTSSGLIISMAGALSHDLFKGGVRTFRLSAVAVGIVATVCALSVASFPINVLVGWAFAIAASSFCPLLVLGIWWPRLTWPGALVGIVLGGGGASIAVLATMLGAGTSGWPEVLLSTPAIWTVPLAFLVMITVSLATPGELPVDVAHKLLALHVPEGVRRITSPS